MTYELGDGDRSQLEAVNAALSAPKPPPPARPWWRRNLRWIAIALVVDVVVGNVLWRVLRDEKSTPERAVQQAVKLVADGDWDGLRHALCTPDRARYSTADLAQGGRTANLVLRGVEDIEVEQVTTVPDVSLGPVSLPARRVHGQLIAALGPPAAVWVTVVKEPTAWKVCLSAGGYGLPALGVDVAPSTDLLK